MLVENWEQPIPNLNNETVNNCDLALAQKIPQAASNFGHSQARYL